MKRETITADKRIVTGKQVKHLRSEGLLPANMFGKGLKSVSVQIPLKDFRHIYSIAGETGLVNLKIENETYPVLIQNVQTNPMTHVPIHADFFKVNLKEKVKAMIGIVAVGEPRAVTEKIGALMHSLSEVEIEALPADLPENFEVNVENLAAVDDSITVADITVPPGVEILTDQNEMIFRIADLVSEAAEELAETEAEEAAQEEVASTETPESTDTTSETPEEKE